jgi:hypothetical protein
VALDVSLIVLEAAGGFETIVAAALAGVGLPLAVVNPRIATHRRSFTGNGPLGGIVDAVIGISRLVRAAAI